MATTQVRYLYWGVSEADSKVAVWNDLPATAEGATAGEAGKGRSLHYGQQIGQAEETVTGTHGEGGPWGSVATTISAYYGSGSTEPVKVIVNGVSYTLIPGTACTVPRIVQAILTSAGIPYA